MIGFLGTIVTLACIVYLVLAIRSKKKGFPKAKHQFRIMWILLGVVVILTIIDPNKGQTIREAQPEQTIPAQETAQASKAKTPNDNQPASSNTTETATISEPVNESKTTEGKETVYVETTTTLDKEAVLTYASILRGSSFIKDVNVGKNNISIAFFPTFQQYKTANPESKITKNNYQDYFSTGDAINKILMEESTRLLKEFPIANEIKMTLPFDGKVYSVDLTKEKAEKFYNGINFSTLKSSGSWGQISNNYFNDADRQRFVDHFVKVN